MAPQALGQGFWERFQEADGLKRAQKTSAALAEFQTLSLEFKPAAGEPNENDWIAYLSSEVSAGICLQELGQWDQSVAYLERVLRDENDVAPSNWCHVHAILAESYLQGGLLALAKPHVDRATELAGIALAQSRQAEAKSEPYFINRTGYAEAQLAAAKYVLATEFYQPAEAILEDLIAVRFPGNREIRTGSKGTALHLLGLTHYQHFFEGGEADDGPAVAAFESALALGDGLLARDRFGCLLRVAHLHLEAGRHAEAEARLDEITSLGLEASSNVYDQAWYTSLRNRLSRERSGTGYAPFGPAYERLLEHLRSIQRPGGVGYFRFVRVRAVAFEAIMQSLQDGGPEAALEMTFRFQELGFLVNRLKAKPARLEALRASLLDDEVCLIYAVGKGRVLTFAVDRSGPIQHWEVARAFELHDAIRLLASEVFVASEAAGSGGAKGEPAWQTAAKTVRDKLFPPEQWAHLAGYRRIRIVDRASLRNPLFEVFPLEGQPLGLTHAITDWPSVVVGLHPSASISAKPVAKLDWLVLMNPVLSEEAKQRVPNQEALIADFPRSPRLKVLGGSDATLSQWMQNDSAQVVQILSHGVPLGTPEWSAGIALSADDALADGLLSGLDLLETTQLQAPALAILSICRGNAGFVQMGDPAAGHLAGALLGMGSRAILTSRSDANVYLKPTRAFHAVVREQLAAGARLDDATLAARQALLAKGAFAAPMHWAAWQVIGDGALQLELAESVGAGLPGMRWNPWALGALVVLALLCAWCWIARRKRAGRNIS